MKNIHDQIKSGALALLPLLLPCSLMAAPITVRIDDTAKGPPVIEVLGVSPANGYNIYVGPNVNNPAGGEDGALITLFGVNNYFALGDGTDPTYMSNMGWRYTDPKAPDPTHSAADIVWFEHDFDFFGTGDLRVGFNSHWPGGWYPTPGPNPPPGADVNAGPVRPNWVTVFSNDTLVLQFRGPAPTTQ
jgi:hypothetical protein